MSQHGCPERLSNRSKGFQEESAGQATMEVLVETLTGTAFEMTVSPSDTIFAIKSKIFRVEGIPVSQQHLVYNLKELDDAASLCALGIGDGARLRLVLGMRGGPISTRRLPPPPSDISGELERLLGTNRYRESSSWSGASGSSGCKVTVLVFRDGERVNMLRVRENRDGSLQPLEHAKYSSSLPAGAGAAGGARDNAVTMNKMLELRRRMETLSVQRRRPENKVEIQKTRSEESLSVPSLLDEPRPYTPYSEADDGFAPLYDGHYTRYDYDCAFDRYTLLPPIGSRTESSQSVDRLPEDGRLLPDARAGSVLLQARRDDDAAILEECLDAAVDDAPPSAEYGPLVGSGAGLGAGGWRTRGFGSSSALAAPGGAGAAREPSLALLPAPLATALFSSSTSDLEALRRNMLPLSLSRHRPREHLHLSDERLAPKPEPRRRSQRLRFDSFEDVKNEVEKEPEKKEKKVTRIRCGFCKKRLSIATVHKCRCGAEFCAPHRYAEVHGCAYDYKANAHQYLQRANPLVSAPKLPKI